MELYWILKSQDFCEIVLNVPKRYFNNSMKFLTLNVTLNDKSFSSVNIGHFHLQPINLSKIPFRLIKQDGFELEVI
jgi:hypothetical protein